MSRADSVIEDVELAKAGDNPAWERLFVRFRPLLDKLAQELTFRGSPEISGSDLVQEAWLRICKGIGQFRGSPGDEHAVAVFCQWVRTTARRAMLNVLEARNAKNQMPAKKLLSLDQLAASHWPSGRAVAPDKTPSQLAAEDEERKRLQRARETVLSETERTLVDLVFANGLSLKQASIVLDMTYDRVRRQFHAALRKLEKECAT